MTHEALARTSPDLRDLFVALAAGAAGAYATAREDLSAALPGVAVALVPPLATVGFTGAAGRLDLAGGALLLFVANLIAIVFAGIAVFAITGLAPRKRVAARSRSVTTAVVAVAVAMAAVAVPLAGRSAAAIRHARRLQQINTAVTAWLATTDLALTDVNVTGEQVGVDVAGPQPPPDTEPLRRGLVAYLGPLAAVRVRWFQNATATMAQPSKSPTTTLRATAAELRPVVQTWLAASAAGADAFNITAITVVPDHVAVDVSGPVAPPPAADLARLVAAQLGRSEKVNVHWTQTAAPTGSASDRVRAAVRAWLSTRPDIDLVNLSIAGPKITVDLAGSEPPDNCGRDRPLGRPPAQIPACAASALGSCLGCER